MDHSDHVDLLREGVPEAGGVWADFGSGSGAFTLALADLIGPAGQIHAIDTDRKALRRLEQTLQRHFPATSIHIQAADFTRQLKLPPLDGVVMANSLHFHRHKGKVLGRVRASLKPGGRLLLVEYDTDRGNIWVPHPLTYSTWKDVAARSGFESTTLLATKPSRFLGQIFSAVSRYRGQ